MKTFQLSGTERKELGKKATRELRKQNQVPCNIYGLDKNINFVVDANAVRKLIYTPEIFVVELTIDGKAHKAILKELQFHPVSDRLLHIDFLEVTENKPVVMAVPARLDGHAEGVKAGGKLVQNLRYLKVKGLYNDIPEFLTVDVTSLNIGKAIKVKDLSYDKLELVSAAENVVATVKATRQAAAVAAAAAAAAK